jgi:plastocyanin
MSRTISVFINDQPQHYPVSPMMSAGRVLVPMRETFQSLGAKVTWDARARKVTATREGTEVILKLGDRRAMVGGKPMMLDAPPQMRQGHVFVPLRFVGECVGARVAWDARAYRVMIATRPPAAMPAPAVAAPAAPAATAAAAPPAASTTAALPSPAEAPAASGAEAAAATEPAATELATMLTREQRVRVKLTDYHIACQPEKAVAGPVIFYVSNDGPSPHALAIDGMKDRTPNLKAGEKTKLKVELEPGTYTLYCPIGAHRILGMKTRFVVESP